MTNLPQPLPPEDLERHLALLAGRRTIHAFEPECPPDEVLLRGLEVAVQAPNHKGTEPWRFYTLGPDSVAAVVDLNSRLVSERRGPEAGEAKRKRWSAMPGWLLVTSLRDGDDTVDRENYAAVCCAVQNLSLALWAQGIGMKWGTGPVTTHEELPAIVGFDPGQERVVGLFWYGRPQAVPKQERQPLGQVLRRCQ